MGSGKDFRGNLPGGGVTHIDKAFPTGPLGPNPDNDKVRYSEPHVTRHELDRQHRDDVHAVSIRGQVDRLRGAAARAHAMGNQARAAELLGEASALEASLSPAPSLRIVK